jgi:hypothetical protein
MPLLLYTCGMWETHDNTRFVGSPANNQALSILIFLLWAGSAVVLVNM